MKRFLKSTMPMVIGFAMILLTACAGLTQSYEELYDDPDLLLEGSYGCTQFVHVKVSKPSEYKDSCKKFSGYYECFELSVSEKTEGTLSVTVESGKMKVVLVGKSAVYVLADGNYEGEIAFAEVPAGKYDFALVGVEAKYSLTFTH